MAVITAQRALSGYGITFRAIVVVSIGVSVDIAVDIFWLVSTAVTASHSDNSIAERIK